MYSYPFIIAAILWVIAQDYAQDWLLSWMLIVLTFAELASVFANLWYISRYNYRPRKAR